MLDEKLESINHDASPWEPAIKYGLISGLLGIVMNLAGYMTGSLQESFTGVSSPASTATSFFGVAIAIFAVVKAVSDYKSNIGGAVSYGKIVGVGALTGLVYGLLTAIWSYVFYSFIFVEYADLMQELFYAQTEEGDFGDDELEMMKRISGIFSSPTFLSIASIFVGVIVGTIISTIAGLFMKTD